MAGRRGYLGAFGPDRAVAERIYLVESALPPEGVESFTSIKIDLTTSGGHAFSASRDIPDPLYLDISDARPPFVFKVATVDYATAADDPDRPDELWDGRIVDPGNMSRSVSLTPVGAASVDVSTGQIVIANGDAAFDTAFDDYFALSQELSIKVGNRSVGYVGFTELWRVRITGLSIRMQDVTLEVAAPTFYADNELARPFFTGDGLSGGDADLAGTRMPFVLGQVFNHAPTLQNAAELIYRVHGALSSGMTSVAGVFDGGVPLTFGTDRADFTAMAANAPATGNYDTCLAEGLVRLGGTPAFTVTVNCVGQSGAGSTTATIADWLSQEAETTVGVEFDSPAFAGIASYSAGWVWTDLVTYRAALDRFVGDSGWFWGSLGGNLITTGKLEPPVSGGTPAAIYDESDILLLERVSLPAGYESTHASRGVRYQRNWRVQTDNDLAATAIDKPFRQTEWREVQVAAPFAPGKLRVQPPVLDTSLLTRTAAETVAQWLVDMHGSPRKMFRVRVKSLGLTPELGAQVELRHTRFGLSQGKQFRVVSIAEKFADSTATFLLWG